ncbi:hypothetical protein FOXG_22802 [Fusarium oxysporum f. sp. lycopersici 4287]|uniref:DUF7029 domain-containing protein n=2 Tax=Fusarium oxysporum TaxID=5507 RepID=A0A0J9WAG0_FUSO4|nr:uncharacterized protein FOXG_22802 [Fusarium oxysporum f. sp. lycopersici 4287]EXK26414.1 hypothetical protein FOMG_16962 [Fusarium oxysporum f. sp. melonis 26406]KNB20344.1 hypothetical protein FOXG_22802 [Fusarium oxysporum f. sp. lycopersici 4287]
MQSLLRPTLHFDTLSSLSIIQPSSQPSHALRVAGKIIFITSADGCGEDHANDLFLAQSVNFNGGTKTFTAKGSTTECSSL